MATSATAAPPLLTTESSSKGKVCGACGVLKSKDEYSKAQWNPKKKTRRCKDCVEQDLPLTTADEFVDEEPYVEQEQNAGVFEALDAQEEAAEPAGVFDALALAHAEDPQDDPPALAEETQMQKAPQRKSLIYRVPVRLFQDENGQDYFYLRKDSFPNRSITKLKIWYGDQERAQVKEQVLANNRCPEIFLANAQVMCYLSGARDADGEEGYLNDESLKLTGSKVRAIRMRMYAQQKQDAQAQLEDPNCQFVLLTLNMEIRLKARDV